MESNDYLGKYYCEEDNNEIEIKALPKDIGTNFVLLERDKKYEFRMQGDNWLMFENYYNVKFFKGGLFLSKGSKIGANAKRYLKKIKINFK